MSVTWPKWLRLSSEPDRVIHVNGIPYLRRWYIIPRNKWFNIYLHQFLESDQDEALHDHPWCWMSMILSGWYIEQTPEKWYIRKPFRPRVGKGSDLHRVILYRSNKNMQKMLPVWTIFVTGPAYRTWGFQCKDKWVDWKTYCKDNPS